MLPAHPSGMNNPAYGPQSIGIGGSGGGERMDRNPYASPMVRGVPASMPENRDGTADFIAQVDETTQSILNENTYARVL